MPMAAGNAIPQEWAGKYPIIGGVRPEEWDGFHDFVLHDELTRVGGIGYVRSTKPWLDCDMTYVSVTDGDDQGYQWFIWRCCE